MMTVTKKKPSFLNVFLFSSLLFVGLFHEYLSCIASLFLLGYLFYRRQKKKETSVPLGPGFFILSLLIASYGVVSLWAVEASMAVIGFFKFLPVFLFYLSLGDGDERKKLRASLPYCAALLTVLSFLLSLLPAFGGEFLVAGRLAGTFQYPNAFAIFLLVSELELIGKEKISLCDLPVLLILLAGFVYTGSRTAFVIGVLANLVILLVSKDKKVRLAVLGGGALCVAVLILYSALFDSFGIFSRLLNISLKESTFVGRILYTADALPTILTHPFGLGYLGYYHTQASFQTGVYSVVYAHNDLIQFFLDVGWIPALAMGFWVVKSILKKGTSLTERVILSSFALHFLFDFDLQFVSLFFVLLLYLDHKSKKTVDLSAWKQGYTVLLAFSFVLCAYVGLSLTAERFLSHETAYELAPWNTRNALELLAEKEDVEEAASFAETLLERSDALLLPHCARARLYYAQGDFAKLIDEKKAIINSAPFMYEEYEEFAYMLISGIQLYNNVGDQYSVSVCQEELVKLKNGLESLPERLSSLGKQIKDQPEITLPEDVLDYIEKMEGQDEK